MLRADKNLRGSEDRSELIALREENTRLTRLNQDAFAYIRAKVDSLLEVVGTRGLRPEELDDHSLIALDPIGIVSHTFKHVLENLQQTNRKLHFAHDEIQTVFDTVGAAVMVLDPQGIIVTYNQRTRDWLLGGDFDIHGKKCLDAVCQGHRDDPRCVFFLVMKNCREQQFSNWSFQGRSFDVIGRPMFDEDGEITHVVLAYHDVTARRKAEDDLLLSLKETQEANAKIHGLLRSAADGILITDAEGRVVLINQCAEELLGVSLKGKISPLAIDMIPHAGVVSLLHEAQLCLQETSSDDLLFELGSAPRIFQARTSVLLSPQDGFNGSVTLLHEVTEQRAIDRMKNEFISTAAHELRTPLATIIGYADLLLMDHTYPKEQQQEFLLHIHSKAERLAEIVNNLLDISRIESGVEIQLDRKPQNLEKLCEEVVLGHRSQPSAHDFVLDFPPPPGIQIMVDRYALMQVFENLVSNAMKYSPRGGTIRITGRIENGSCHLSVSDQGVGMRSDQLARVFDKFYRADASNTAISGTGLGMTIVKHLVEAHAGQVTLDSVLGKGTIVTITLPLSANESPPVKSTPS